MKKNKETINITYNYIIFRNIQLYYTTNNYIY